ncbi:oxidoreductase [Mycobacterium sp. MYCO198283]|uniref:oxidoreductase n=1 Tax=Mycobacterium sp. MYCO198283 TaxID=2883505 RepID=UPI001E51C2B6|nr:oxidoreductase [Mycobacterium sp. MYCO198283]MCG5432803.1 oxidoreductase [Mycobacterium sp. MYCO198283]
MSADLLAPLTALPGVAAASEEVREALGKVHRHRTNLRGWPASAAESALRGARSSSVLDGGSLHLPTGDEAAEPVLAGALRVGQALEGGATSLVSVWQRAPMQALARLHSLAAADLTDDERLGRPRDDAAVAGRLALLANILDTSTAPAPVLAAVAHGEILSLAPFGTADGVVARAVSRLITIVTGLDPHGLGVPEVHWMRRIGDYRAAAEGFGSGRPDSLRRWILLCCDGLREGAREGMSIAASAK